MRKRLWTRLTAAAAAGMLALSSCPVMAAAQALEAEAVTEEAAEETGEKELPEEGDVVCGYEVTETRDFDLMDARIVLFRHQKSER